MTVSAPRPHNNSSTASHPSSTKPEPHEFLNTTMSRTTLGHHYDDTESLTASLDDFDPDHYLTNHSGTLAALREDMSDNDTHSEVSSTPWSPPAWRKSGSGWQQRHNLPPPSASRSHSARSTSPQYYSVGAGAEDCDDTLLPSRIPLPASPPKGTPRNSVEPTADVYPREPEFAPTFGAQSHNASREVTAQPETSNNNNNNNNCKQSPPIRISNTPNALD